MATKQIRKAGDALLLSGALGGSVGLLENDSDWAGAEGMMHIVQSTNGAVVRNELCTLEPPVSATKTLARYDYVGAPLVVGKYLYEIEVSFVGLDDPITFPNDKTKFELEVIPQLA